MAWSQVADLGMGGWYNPEYGYARSVLEDPMLSVTDPDLFRAETLRLWDQTSGSLEQRLEQWAASSTRGHAGITGQDGKPGLAEIAGLPMDQVLASGPHIAYEQHKAAGPEGWQSAISDFAQIAPIAAMGAGAIGAFGAGAGAIPAGSEAAMLGGPAVGVEGAALGSAAAGGTAATSLSETLSQPDWLNQLLSETGELGANAASLEAGFNPAISNAPWWNGLPNWAQNAMQLAPRSGSGPQPQDASTAAAAARILSGNGSLQDYLSVGGLLGGTALGAYASNKQSQSLEDLANKYMDMGAPSRARYEGSFAPGFSMANDPGYSDALDQTTKSFLHKASIAGNPADSPNAWAQTLKDVNASFAYPAMMDYRKLNANTGGLSRFAEAAPGVATGAIGAQRGIYDSIGYGLSQFTTQPQQNDIFGTNNISLAELLKRMNKV